MRLFLRSRIFATLRCVLLRAPAASSLAALGAGSAFAPHAWPFTLPKSLSKALPIRGWAFQQVFGADTRLDRALLADGQDVRYFYGQELLPVKITRNGSVVAEYQWHDRLRLLRHKDALSGLVHEFVYGDRRSPVQCIVSGTKEALYNATGHYERSLTLNVWTDQVDSIRVLSLLDGRPVKCIEYDAFGNVAADTRPEWKFPLGFACGLNDHFTGLVRFGFRDYDPRFGRFTAKDPIGDTGGDHDLWDYCVDDPVSCNDTTGLIPLPLLIVGGHALAGAIAGVGVWAASKSADAIAAWRTGTSSTKVRDGVAKIQNHVDLTRTIAGAVPTSGLIKTGAAVLAKEGMRKSVDHVLQYPETRYQNSDGTFEGYD